MSGIAVIIGAAFLLALGGLIALLWALANGQFDDLKGDAERILIDDENDFP